jgi:hypothetical protein
VIGVLCSHKIRLVGDQNDLLDGRIIKLNCSWRCWWVDFLFVIVAKSLFLVVVVTSLLLFRVHFRNILLVDDLFWVSHPTLSLSENETPIHNTHYEYNRHKEKS